MYANTSTRSHGGVINNSDYTTLGNQAYFLTAFFKLKAIQIFFWKYPFAKYVLRAFNL